MLALGAGFATARILQRPDGAAAIVWWLAILGMASLVLVVLQPLARRAIVLAKLLNLTHEFPSAAPARPAVAWRWSDPAAVHRALDRVHADQWSPATQTERAVLASVLSVLEQRQAEVIFRVDDREVAARVTESDIPGFLQLARREDGRRRTALTLVAGTAAAALITLAAIGRESLDPNPSQVAAGNGPTLPTLALPTLDAQPITPVTPPSTRVSNEVEPDELPPETPVDIAPPAAPPADVPAATIAPDLTGPMSPPIRSAAPSTERAVGTPASSASTTASAASSRVVSGIVGPAAATTASVASPATAQTLVALSRLAPQPLVTASAATALPAAVAPTDAILELDASTVTTTARAALGAAVAAADATTTTEYGPDVAPTQSTPVTGAIAAPTDGADTTVPEVPPEEGNEASAEPEVPDDSSDASEPMLPDTIVTPETITSTP